MNLPPRNLALTGIPRSGTTLCCHLLSQCPSTVALFEPMAVSTLPGDRAAAIREVEHYFGQVREQIRSTATAPSKQVDGRVPDNPFSGTAADSRRRLVVEEGTIKVDVAGADYLLVIKHNAAFTALLPELGNAVPVIAIVRNPVAALASWTSVDLPVREGRAPAGESLDPELRDRISALPTVLERQIVLLDWFFERFSRLDPARVLRYEDIVSSHGEALFTVAGSRPGHVPRLASRNRPGGDTGVPTAAITKLMSGSRAWERWYTTREIEEQYCSVDAAE
ncbi:hypothetical protein GCM10008101_26410 [Lysobacter xinjiangensis]|uniref:Sulfotransferase family protein n=1 Tax=Cognatilysobacter xinjiangensis TaxID=546892 RepID=A0ABQ3CAU0_9GAMM|nr:hypothetical protein [Lysobacter xinjiangensis]GGZ70778.1 hypothetical protein GCM10008101_26410 [Lysobacter xinjiangensis]